MRREEEEECCEKAIRRTGRQGKKDKRAIIECVYYLMLSSRMRTRKRGRPCIFQHCLMNCRAFCTHRHTQTLCQTGMGGAASMVLASSVSEQKLNQRQV